MRQQPVGTFLSKSTTALHGGIAADIYVIPAASRTHDLPQIPLEHDQPTLFVIDAGKDPERAIAQIERVRERFPSAHIAILADYYRRDDLVSAYQAGANVALARDMTCGVFMKALELIVLGETIMPPELLPFIGDHEDHHDSPPPAPSVNGGLSETKDAFPLTIPRLSAREKCILRCIVEGDTNKAIARKISIAEATVKVHVKAILRKVRLSNRTQAAIWALNNNSLLSPADTDLPAVAALVVPPPLAPKAAAKPNGRSR
jgi:two-component system nitrate/nitrite response regulator NarL